MMFIYVLLSTVHASGNARAQSMQKMSCRPTNFWSKLGYKINSIQNDRLRDWTDDWIQELGEFNDAVAALMHLQTLEHRVACQDVDGDVKPCTDLYTKATCQQVAKFFRPKGENYDEWDAMFENCKVAGTQEDLTQLECKRPRNYREVCNGTFYFEKKDSRLFGKSTSIICLEGWAFAPGRKHDRKKITDVDCNNPDCIELSREDRIEKARAKLVSMLKVATETAVGKGMDKSTRNALKSLLKVLEGEPPSDVLLDLVAEKLSDLRENAKEFFVNVGKDAKEFLVDVGKDAKEFLVDLF